MTNGGRRPGSGRHHRDTIRVGCTIPRPIYDELVRHERATRTYRTRIIATLICEGLIGEVVGREIEKAVSQTDNGHAGVRLISR